MTTTSEKILKSIQEAHIKPEPKWKFLAKNQAVWMAFGVAMLIGSLSFAVILEMLTHHDWDIYPYLHKTFAEYVLFSLPYVWIVCLVAFSLVAYYNFVHIKGWYRHRVYLVVSTSVFLSVGFGTAFFFMGLGEKIDQVLTNNVSYYGALKLNNEALWNHPDEGLLAGEVIDVKNDNEFTLQDYAGNQWEVDDSVSTKTKVKAVDVGENVKIIGKEDAKGKFSAKEIREWESRKNIKKEQKTKREEKGSSDVCQVDGSRCATDTGGDESGD